jgi:Flp pilus assembly protein CpaB
MLERLFATRKGAVAVGLAAAAVALVLLLVYVKQYRHNVSATAQTTQVLVARSLIQKGTPGNVVGSKHLYELRAVPKNTVQLGALIDPASLRTGVALQNIFPGQQLVAADFGVPTNVLDTTISGGERAISIPIDSSRALAGQIEPGDHVDIYYAQSGATNACSTAQTTALFLQDVNVIQLLPGGGEITLQVSPTEAARLAYATDNGKLWFTLRAKIGVPAQAPVVICAKNVLPANVRTAVTP